MASVSLHLREALTDTMSSGQFIDTKIVLYSKRSAYGTVYKPKALYANSHVLKSVPYFKDLFSGGFAESELKDLSLPVDESEEAENYDYDSDSDLDEDDLNDGSEVSINVNSGEDAAQSGDTTGTKGDVQKRDTTSVKDAVHRRGATSGPANGTKKSTMSKIFGPLKGHSPDLQHLSAKDKKPAPADVRCHPSSISKEKSGTCDISMEAASIEVMQKLPLQESACLEFERNGQKTGKGQIIKVHDVAFITFQACLMYLYTGHIEFAPYGSKGNRRLRRAEITSSSEDSIPRPSPKSVYRLADKYDIPALKKLAFDKIKETIKQCDIFEESFSKFSSRHEDIRTMFTTELGFVLMFCPDKESAEYRDNIDINIDLFYRGELDHAQGALTNLWKFSQSPSDLLPLQKKKSPPEFSPSKVSPPDLKPIKQIVKTILIKSIRTGIFFDRKYWARNSKTVGDLRPIYTSSILTGEKINTFVKPDQGDKFLDTGERSDDSDYESSSEQVYESTAEAQDNKKGETLLILTKGSLASWRSLFFYLWTDVIQFAPLKSQGVDQRAQCVREHKVKDSPPPCSPKAIYSLAKTLEIDLHKEAYNNIMLNLTSTNILTEVFSDFSSREPDILEMELEKLNRRLRGVHTKDKGVEFIKSIRGGTSTHHIGALKQGLRTGLSGGAYLRCHKSSCQHHRGLILRNNPEGPRMLECPKNKKHGLLQCSACGTAVLNFELESDDNACKNQKCKRFFYKATTYPSDHPVEAYSSSEESNSADDTPAYFHRKKIPFYGLPQESHKHKEIP